MVGFNDWLDVTDPKLMAETIAERFRLSQQELSKAQEALAPAFALGLQRAMSTPAAWGDLAAAFSAMAPGASAAQRTLPGQAFLDAFFGSDALSGAVARQASLFAGIAPDTIQKLMPSLAMLTMETMVRGAMANMQRNQLPGLATGDFGGATAEMMRRGANAVEALSRPSDAPGMRASPMPQMAQMSQFTQNPFTEAFTEAMKTSLSFFQGTPGLAPAPARETAPPPVADFNPMLPFAAMFEAFAKGMQAGDPPVMDEHRGAEPATAGGPDPLPAATAATEAAAVGGDAGGDGTGQQTDDLVGEMLRSGQKFQADYAREMASLFDRYQKATP